MCAHVISVVRSATRLEALTYDAGEPVDRQAPWRVEHRCTLRPLAAREYPELTTAFEALASVTRWDATTLVHVQTILRGTVPAMDSQSDLPALGPEVQPPEPPRATAAHPRAYRGTKHRPPRPSQPEAVDEASPRALFETAETCPRSRSSRRRRS
ncbi:MAG: hypothetical protein SFX73_01590 [Kofleriaceae bacterium]|nr:hypothetical protein [Kofleriaceae bacterium]